MTYAEAPAEGRRPEGEGANIDRRLVPYHVKCKRIQSRIEFIYICIHSPPQRFFGVFSRLFSWLTGRFKFILVIGQREEGARGLGGEGARGAMGRRKLEKPLPSELNVDNWNDNCEAKSEAKSSRPSRGFQVDSSLTRNVPYAVR